MYRLSFSRFFQPHLTTVGVTISGHSHHCIYYCISGIIVYLQCHYYSRLYRAFFYKTDTQSNHEAFQICTSK